MFKDSLIGDDLSFLCMTDEEFEKFQKSDNDDDYDFDEMLKSIPQKYYKIKCLSGSYITPDTGNPQLAKTKMLIELSENVNDADIVIEEYTGFKTIDEKITFLRGIFDFELIGHGDDTKNEAIDYYSVLNAIIDL